MLEPNGPLPPEIYWRRRALAIGVAVVALVLVVWLIVSLTSSDDPDATATGSSATLTPTPTTTYRPDASSNPGPDAQASGGGGGAAAGSSTAATTTPSGSATPVAAGQCSDQSLAVKASPDQPTYQAGQEPKFTIVVTNIGTSACSRDLGSGLQQVLVYTLENQRLWSNIDCFPATAADVRNLAPGQQAPFTVTWSATTSEPGCTAPRNPVGAGAYSVVGQLGELRSSPETFNIA
ncbi:hypothetical protein ACNHUS_07585 [Actinomycetes bacterium M1A6_2h]